VAVYPTRQIYRAHPCCCFSPYSLSPPRCYVRRRLTVRLFGFRVATCQPFWVNVSAYRSSWQLCRRVVRSVLMCLPRRFGSLVCVLCCFHVVRCVLCVGHRLTILCPHLVCASLQLPSFLVNLHYSRFSLLFGGPLLFLWVSYLLVRHVLIFLAAHWGPPFLAIFRFISFRSFRFLSSVRVVPFDCSSVRSVVCTQRFVYSGERCLLLFFVDDGGECDDAPLGNTTLCTDAHNVAYNLRVASLSPGFFVGRHDADPHACVERGRRTLLVLAGQR
jgi:hypothetical protein